MKKNKHLFRKNNQLYLKELEENAKRAIKKGYNVRRNDELLKINKNKRIITGAGRMQKKWSEEDIKLLRDKSLLPRLQLCLLLNRSWGSVNHKIERLKLQKYNKWNK